MKILHQKIFPLLTLLIVSQFLIGQTTEGKTTVAVLEFEGRGINQMEAATLAAGLEGLASLSDPNAPPPALGIDPMSVMNHPLAGMPGGPMIPGGKGAPADAQVTKFSYEILQS